VLTGGTTGRIGTITCGKGSTGVVRDGDGEGITVVAGLSVSELGDGGIKIFERSGTAADSEKTAGNCQFVALN
jgi:hypothetical protein